MAGKQESATGWPIQWGNTLGTKKGAEPRGTPRKDQHGQWHLLVILCCFETAIKWAAIIETAAILGAHLYKWCCLFSCVSEALQSILVSKKITKVWPKKGIMELSNKHQPITVYLCSFGFLVGTCVREISLLRWISLEYFLITIPLHKKGSHWDYGFLRSRWVKSILSLKKDSCRTFRGLLFTRILRNKPFDSETMPLMCMLSHGLLRKLLWYHMVLFSGGSPGIGEPRIAPGPENRSPQRSRWISAWTGTYLANCIIVGYLKFGWSQCTHLYNCQIWHIGSEHDWCLAFQTKKFQLS